jgi:hypothetical protein
MNLVRIYRSIDGSETLRGCVMHENRKWLLLANLHDGVFFDGYIAVRQRHIINIQKHRGFEKRALAAMGSVPSPLEGLAAESTKSLITDMAQRFPLMSVYREFRNPDTRLIGHVLTAKGSHLELRNVDSNGEMDHQPARVALREITRLEWGTMYNVALKAAVHL